ncbi:5-deoxy-glucuronate isomerase [Paenibacillus xerothermodurans]|uniref:5-deoxy-glucuronate isomerase n=1 Tax=Paenibacillus xerothermodurans TaxID=1977292 RepID=A0A2W1N6X0_PAEXE|nr:5-deoxy-glucuronate isomerase [Paenibacillus xerothermodurans]PZE20187.1 5-deoxy-glucuronate isomerase [Paenibacillus xerothermodurans]
MSHLFKAHNIDGYQDIIPENNSLLTYLALGKISLNKDEQYSCHTDGYEMGLVILSGQATIEIEKERWSDLGERQTVFDGKATTVYIPCRSNYTITAQTDHLEVAVCKAKAETKFTPFVVRPSDVVVNARGKELWQREVHGIITDNGDSRVHRLVLGETYNQAGHLSSYPPHKHDGEFAPEEPNLEEVYYYQLDPQHGFGVQLHYTKDQSIDQSYIVRNGDSFAIDKGYHPVSAAAGYRLYYLWFMAGPETRILQPFDDRDHAWLK